MDGLKWCFILHCCIKAAKHEEQFEFLTVLLSNITFKVIFSKILDSELANLHILL